ncbi:isoprenyl transferase [Endomicrobium proavitum]|uniref:Isoprenyl transferase n=1 Tax=Endomicrobium proavitum TaxID=1408281 RepID=A0A0G3WIF2_9BACT|nr:isoprenyl transferase [Endomicrobium proavitum]AKL97652.1 undecaprenyl pyrophosphate synthase [Endomicrobium proavitum]
MSVPLHVAIIMDGNGRWAKRRALPRVFGHKQGVKTVKNIVKAADALGIKVLTLYAFSTENWKRPQKEIGALFSLLKQFIKIDFKEFADAGIRLRILGDLKKFPKDLQKEIIEVVKTTSRNKGLQLNIALNYGARQELARAFNLAIKKGVKKVSDKIISSFLYTAGQPDPDLLIRTSGEQRISNFLLWQIAYSEIYVTKKLWPDFSDKDLKEAIKEYQKRERRFGGI